MDNQRIGVIIQARMGSTRLPGKVLLELDKNERVLDVLIKRLKISSMLDEIIIATTPDRENSSIIEVVKEHNVNFFVGSENDVLERYYFAAKQFNLTNIIRITSDCPFVDPFVLDNMIRLYFDHNYDYIKNFDQNTKYTRGFEIEIFSFKILEKIFLNAKEKQEREHVTFYIYTHPKEFKIFTYMPEVLNQIEDLRLTIDEKNDFLLCKELFKRLKEDGKLDKFTINDIYGIIRKNPHLLKINRDVVHKTY